MAEITVQVLKDTTDALIVKFVNSGNASAEVAVEKVNAASLSYATFALNSNSLSNVHISESGWVAGEYVVGATTGIKASVIAWNYATNALAVVGVQANSSGGVTFGNGELITGMLTNSHFLMANVASPVRSLDFESIWFCIPSGARVDIQWEGVTNAAVNAVFTAASLYGTGYWGKNELAGIFKAPASSNTFTANGSIALSSVGLTANGGYTVVVEFRKGDGFSPIPDERVQ